MNSISKFQKFEMATINRAEIKNAAYNPRTITDEARKRLKHTLKDKQIGLVQPLIWNKRNGNLVGGHQRLSIIDDLEKKNGGILFNESTRKTRDHK